MTEELARKNDALTQKSRELVRLGHELARANETLQLWLERLEQANRNLGTLHDINRVLSQTLDQNEVFNLALECLESAVGRRGGTAGPPLVSRLGIWLLSDDRSAIFLAASRGTGRRRDAAPPAQPPLDPAVSARSAMTFTDVQALGPDDRLEIATLPPAMLERVLDEGEPLFLEDVATAPELSTVLAGHDVGSLYVWPILVDGQAIGLLAAAARRAQALEDDDLRMIFTIAAQIAVAVGKARLYREALLDRDLLAAVIRSMGDGMITMDWEMKITSMNQAAEEITGWKAAEVRGRPAPEVFRSADGGGYGLCPSPTPLADILQSPELAERGLESESVLATRDGRTIHVACTHSILHVGGTPLGGVAIFRDVTQKANQAQQRMDYVASLSHDIRTPLAAIKGYALTLVRHERQLDEATRREFLMVINAEIDRLARLLDNLMSFSRMEVGPLVGHATAFDLAPVVKRVADLHALTTHKHALRLTVAPELGLVFGDVDQVEQVLNNLVSNAVKYAPNGGDIDVVAERAAGDGERPMARVTVADRGVGIAPDEIPRLFQRYQRLRPGGGLAASGSGLGLFITRNLVEAQGGNVEVTSEPGLGSRFSFTLPLA